jgi:hypothetical protein
MGRSRQSLDTFADFTLGILWAPLNALFFFLMVAVDEALAQFRENRRTARQGRDE